MCYKYNFQDTLGKLEEMQLYFPKQRNKKHRNFIIIKFLRLCDKFGTTFNENKMAKFY